MQIADLIHLPQVENARNEALQAASIISQTDDNAASAYASHERSSHLVDLANRTSEDLGKHVDICLAVLWSIPKGISDPNSTRQFALYHLQVLANAALSDSNRDFVPLNCLESSREGTVELVRCRFDRRIYVLKSTTKGAAKRGFRTNSPMTERRLLCVAKNETKGVASFTPSCIAAFQSPGSLHILMEYCPAGDLYHFLESAGQAPIDNDARNTSGGLLSEKYVHKYAIDMVAAISWLHAQGYMHRDIKPGNWLFDKSGHLMLCDLASSAPFSFFDHIPPFASLPQADGLRTSKLRQRRVLYRHCCLIGTADYIAPEVFWTADFQSRKKITDSSFESKSDLSSASEDSDPDNEDDDEPPPDGPGLYGPECDWWSLGVVLFEMVYKRMPFFSDNIAETMEMIKHHESHLTFDKWVSCSQNLQTLLKGLIAKPEERLGLVSSEQVQRHPFFQGVDWSHPWKDAAPFLPNLENTFEKSDSNGHSEPEPSILHSPRTALESRSFLAPWTAYPDEINVFPNSVEISRAMKSPSDDHGMQEVSVNDEVDRDATLTESIASDRTAVGETDMETKWGYFDPTWMGFSFVPRQDAFHSDAGQNSVQHVSFADSVDIVDDNKEVHHSHLPVTSTPLPKRGHVTNLHRHVLETARKTSYSPFVTPMRATTSSDQLSQFRTPYPSHVGSDGPNSPYPFPVATSARPKATPGPRGITVLKRNDLDRARSASVESGEGSDSRCSGGTNAKREISEREAWRELKAAVMQSARKGRRAEVNISRFRDSREGGSSDMSFPRDRHLSNRRVSFEPMEKPSLSRLASNRLRPSRPLNPLLDTTPPHESDQYLRDSSSPAASTGPADNQYVTRPSLGKRKSARQLLLKAQHKDTPTRTVRPKSPLLTESFHKLNLEREWRWRNQLADVQSPGSDDSPLEQHQSSLSPQDYFGKQRESTPLGHELASPVHQPVTHNIISKLKRQGTLRRRDSRETLSQYRMGINPDDQFYLESQPASKTLSRPKSMAKLDIQPQVTLTLHREANASSPSLPSLPDAFTSTREKERRESHPHSRASQGGAPPLQPRVNEAYVSQPPTLQKQEKTDISRTNKAWSRPALLKRASSYLSRSSGEMKRETVSVGLVRDEPSRRHVVHTSDDANNLYARYDDLQKELQQVEYRLQSVKGRLRMNTQHV